MPEQSQLVPEKIHLRELKIIRGQVSSPADIKEKHIKGFNSEVGLNMGFNLDKHLVKADIEIKATTNSAGKNNEEADTFFEIAFFFEVENIHDLVQKGDSDEFIVHPGLSNAIASISYSTARGILITRLQGTALRDFILPVIDPKKLF